jgi:catechol 2,3-dioxygenase-like lactoylglutathione lyase family enzyme
MNDSASALVGGQNDSVPLLAGVHHLKLPVRDLARSREWYASRLGYQVQVEFVEDGKLMGLALEHPNGGPSLALRLDPARAEAAAGFDYFSIGIPDKPAIEALAARLTELGEEHAGVHFATIGWILPLLHDPDGHEVRFYTIAHHTETTEPITVHNPRETSEAREAAAARERG